MPPSRLFRARPTCLEELEPRDTPAFLALPAFTAGITFPTVAAAGDFNGDGIADLAVGNSGGGVQSIGIALGDGRGGFAAAPLITDAELDFPRAIAVADFNRDGHADLAVGSADPVSPASSLLVFPGNGDGTFGAPVFQFPVPTRAVGVGDFNRDGLLDLVTADGAQQGYRLFFGNAQGSFDSIDFFQQAPLTADRLVVADFDGDGNLDFVGSDTAGQSLVFNYGNGDGTFAPPQFVSGGGDGVDFVVADFDGDGRADVVQTGDSGVIFIRNLGGRQFDPGVPISPSGQSDTRLATADVDRNGLPDVIGVNPFEAHVYLNQGGGVFAQDPAGPYPLVAPAIRVDVVAADVDADGNSDFVVARANGDPPAGDGQVFLNLAPDDTQTTLTSDPNPSLEGQTVTLTATVTPLVPPLPAGGPPTGTVTFVVDGTTLGATPLVNGTATITVSTLTIGTHQVVASYSGDAAFRTSASGPVAQVVNPVPVPPVPPGPTTYSYIVTGLQTVPGAGADRIAAGAFNDDDVPDLVVGAGPGRNAIVTVLDGATGRPIADVLPFGAGFTGGVVVAAGDVDGDGVADVAVVPDRGGGPRARIYLTRGNQLVPAVDFFALDPAFRGGLRAALGDVNHDGFADLVVTGGPGAGPRVAVYDGRSLLPGLTPVRLVNDFFALDPDLRCGLNVAAGDLNGDGFAEIVVGADVGGAPRIAVYDGASVAEDAPRKVVDFFAGPTADRGGVRLAVRDVSGDGIAELITGGGPGSASRVRVYSGPDLYLSPSPDPLFETEPFPGLTTGVYVA